MTIDSKQQGNRHQEFEKSIHLLAQVEPTHSPMVSCYLNTKHGVQEARQYLETMRRDVDAGLSGFEQREFSQAYENIVRELQVGRHVCHGLVFFSRSYEGGNFFQVLELDMVPQNRMSVSAVPDFVPLMILLHEHGHYLHASMSDGAIEINEMGFGNSTLLGMAPLPASSSEESRLAIATHMLERTMRSNPRREVIIDGDLAFIHMVYRTLPR